MRLQVPIACVPLLALLGWGAPRVEAHGGVYRGPPYPTVPPISGPSSTPPGAKGSAGGKTPRFAPRATASLDLRTWETWWALNKDEFFPIRGVGTGGEGQEGYERNRAPSREEARKSIIPVLVRMLGDRDKEVRNSAAVALGKVGGEAELEHLKQALDDRDRSVVEGAILGLGLLRCSAAEELLIGIADDLRRSARERGFATMALGFSGGETARAYLLKDLGHPRAQSRDRSAKLATLQAMAASLVSGSDLPSAGGSGDPATGHLLRGIQHDAVKERTFLPIAYSALAKTRDSAAQKQVLAGLRHRKSEVRAGAAIALGRVFQDPEKRTARFIARVLAAEGDPFSQRLMIISLGRMGGANARKILMRELRDKDRQVRAFSVLALAIMGDQEMAPKFESAMRKTGDHSLKGAYAIALGILRHEASAGAIKAEIQRNKNPDLRSYLVQALMLLGDPAHAEVIERVLVEANSPDLQASSALSLGLLGAESSAELLMNRLSGNTTITVKGAVATALGRLGDVKLIDALVAFVEDEKEQDLARAFGVIALGILGEKDPTIPTFARVAIDSQYEVQLDVLYELRDIL